MVKKHVTLSENPKIFCICPFREESISISLKAKVKIKKQY